MLILITCLLIDILLCFLQNKLPEAARLTGEGAASFSKATLQRLVTVGHKLQQFPVVYQMIQDACQSSTIGNIIPRHFLSKAISNLPENGLVWLVKKLLSNPQDYVVAGK